MESNDLLFSPNSLRLGEIHWYLLRAANEMHAKRYQSRESEGVFSPSEPTEFGKEVAGDEIHWWIFKREDRLDDLGSRTEQALTAAQKLKVSSQKLSVRAPGSYSELLSMLRGFADSWAGEIITLLNYVVWLYGRDPLAPCILYTYRVWGSTRRSDRWWTHPETDRFEEERPDTIRKLTEIVFGLRKGPISTADSVRASMEYDLDAESDPEELRAGPSRVSQGQVLVRIAHEVVSEFATYFEFLRNSLQNILLDIEKYVAQRDLGKSDVFWREFIDWATRSGRTEQQLWDFKKALKMWWLSRGEDKDAAEVEFAEDVASFANSSGGVLIVGVSDLRDVVGIGDDPVEIERRLNYTRQVIAKYIVYSGDIVYFHPVAVRDESGSDKACLVIVIAQASAVVGVSDKRRRFSYPVRRETGLDRADPREIGNEKLHVGSDNYDFVRALDQLVHDKAIGEFE